MLHRAATLFWLSPLGLFVLIGCTSDPSAAEPPGPMGSIDIDSGSDAQQPDAALDSRPDGASGSPDGSDDAADDAVDDATVDVVDGAADVADDVAEDVTVDAPDAADDVQSDSNVADANADGDVEPDAQGPLTSLRIMAANLTSGNYQSYDPGHGIRLIKGLQPDVVLIQEFNYGSNTPNEIRSLVNQATDASFSYYRENGSIPNGIISRYPIIASGQWDDPEAGNREFAWAEIDLPGPKDLWAVSVHFLTSSAATRNKEATALVQYIQNHVPAGHYITVGGDFNTESRTEGCIVTLSAVLNTNAPYPVDQAGNGNTNAGRTKPYDWVLANVALHAWENDLGIGTNLFPNGFVLDSRVYQPLSDVAPVQVNDSDAPSMQHMGVVREFAVP